MLLAPTPHHYHGTVRESFDPHYQPTVASFGKLLQCNDSTMIWPTTKRNRGSSVLPIYDICFGPTFWSGCNESSPTYSWFSLLSIAAKEEGYDGKNSEKTNTAVLLRTPSHKFRIANKENSLTIGYFSSIRVVSRIAAKKPSVALTTSCTSAFKAASE